MKTACFGIYFLNYQMVDSVRPRPEPRPGNPIKGVRVDCARSIKNMNVFNVCGLAAQQPALCSVSHEREHEDNLQDHLPQR